MGEQPSGAPDQVLLEIVGAGPHSTVHCARRRDRAGRIVALKRLAAPVGPAVLAALDHPAIVPVLDMVEPAPRLPAGAQAVVVTDTGGCDRVTERAPATPAA